MQVKKNLMLIAQIVSLALFVGMAAASKTANVGPNEYIYSSPCVGPDYIYVGKFSSEEEAKKAVEAMGLTEYCYTDEYCYAK